MQAAIQDFLNHAGDANMADDATTEATETQHETQQATQSTEDGSQSTEGGKNDVWGVLQPCSQSLNRIDLFKLQPVVSVGRNQEGNEVVLPGLKVSNKHCKIRWDGRTDEKSHVTVYDTSSNGTWINGQKIGKGKSGILKDGNEIAFGQHRSQPESPSEDYRFIYRHMASGPPKGGLHAFYDLGHELGKGSFATVMKGLSRQTGQWYAIKIIHAQTLRRAQASSGSHSSTSDHEAKKAADFVKEISILEKLTHKNICQLKEVFFQESNINLVLELVDGGDLLDYICTRDGLEEPLACHITYQIADALTYVHAQGIVHRDLKPENVLLTSSNPPVVKVADFGLAKVVDSMTRLKTMCGTPSYLAPEVVTQKNQEGYSHLVDAWSVGVIVFSMLTGQTPFIEDESIQDIKVRIAERTIDWAILESVNTSKEALNFVQSLLQYFPKHRMSMSEAKEHPWLATYARENSLSNAEGPAPSVASEPRSQLAEDSVISLGMGESSLSSIPDESEEGADAEMHDADPSMDSGLRKMQLNSSIGGPAASLVASGAPDTDDTPPTGDQAGSSRFVTPIALAIETPFSPSSQSAGGMRRIPLQRQSMAVAEQQEHDQRDSPGKQQPIRDESSWHVIASQEYQQQHRAAAVAAAAAPPPPEPIPEPAPVAGPGPTTRGNKRKLNSIPSGGELTEKPARGNMKKRGRAAASSGSSASGSRSSSSGTLNGNRRGHGSSALAAAPVLMANANGEPVDVEMASPAKTRSGRTRSTRGRGGATAAAAAAAVAATKPAEEEAVEDEEWGGIGSSEAIGSGTGSGRPRRSTRQAPAKAARRA
ncbi:kinase-like protein [Coniophora puteana RWD-64-598 SS2]|uniref:Kinase-like protein n=1 Tax=Coniophora puteana (strain RWD-64-598) TaxID=741705 RepID=A0A5M3MWL8_CONPW|nr:kinase-like protein [Coniophora puteana RWD-64-598 SS2]EIW83460.1 kinase-like protein [Coniophora puteana RWD-64-598 SS2]